MNAEKAAQQEAERQMETYMAADRAWRAAYLARQADLENAALARGELYGIYGPWQPPEEVRGVGIWMISI